MYKSTRSTVLDPASLAILNGLASDGGLYVFTSFPQINLESISNYTYQQLSIYLMEQLLDDYNHDEVTEIVNNAYNNQFDTSDIIQMKHFEDVSFLELYHGPTLAFKDMALTILPGLLAKAKQKHNIFEDTIILTATSGDTGSATLNGFKDIKGMKVVVFYPYNGVSEIQEQQMLKYQSEKLRVISLKGNFDDCQKFVKNQFRNNASLSSSNSINIGRLIPQIVYYFFGYLKMVQAGQISLGEEINVSVPTGNFGNILAGYIAKKMGLPINKLICASNENNVLTDFFKTGIYNKNRPFYKTNSPSMDILISSNLERLLYYLSSEKTVLDLMNQLGEKGLYQIDDKMKEQIQCFYGGYANNLQTIDTIRNVYLEHNYLIDPHTAIAYKVYQDYLTRYSDMHKTMIVSTASFYKFPKTIGNVLGLKDDSDYNLVQAIEQRTLIKKPYQLECSLEKRLVWNLNESEEKFNQLYKELKNV